MQQGFLRSVRNSDCFCVLNCRMLVKKMNPQTRLQLQLQLLNRRRRLQVRKLCQFLVTMAVGIYLTSDEVELKLDQMQHFER